MSREQQRQQQKQRAREESRGESAAQPRTADTAAVGEAAGTNKGKSDMALEEAQVAAGKDGARNIGIQWIDVHLPNGKACRFVVTTTAGNALEVIMEQKSYNKSYHGTSSVATGITPVAPHGTRGRLIVKDLATGETVEQPWIWRSGAGGLWELLKRLFT